MESERFSFVSEPLEEPPAEETDLEASARYLRTIRDDPERSTAERISAIKELRILLGVTGDPSAGPGFMSRAELHAELRRLQALTGGGAGASVP